MMENKETLTEERYTEDGPTDEQLKVQDEIDNEIFSFIGTLRGIYHHHADLEHADLDWDIEKITDIRLAAEKVLDLPNIY